MPALEFIIFIDLFGISLFSFRRQSSDAQNILLVALPVLFVYFKKDSKVTPLKAQGQFSTYMSLSR